MAEVDPTKGEGKEGANSGANSGEGKEGEQKQQQKKAEIPEELKEIVSGMITKEVGKVTAKFKTQLEQKDTELQKLKNANLPDEEKIKAAQKEKDDLIQAQADKIASFEAKDKKIAAIEKAKLVLPKDVSISDLLILMPENDDETIAAKIAIFKKTYVAAKGVGGGMQNGEGEEGKKTKSQELAEVKELLKDPEHKLPRAEKDALINRSLRLTREIINEKNRGAT
jgi:hypothetical protein